MLIHRLGSCTQLGHSPVRPWTTVGRAWLLLTRNVPLSTPLRSSRGITTAQIWKGAQKLYPAKQSQPAHRLLLVRRAVDGAAPKKVKLQAKDVWRLIGLVKSEKLTLAAGIACLIVSSGITMSVPYALGKVMDIIFDKKDERKEIMNRLRKFIGVLLCVFIVGGLANFGRVYLFNSASLRIVRDLRSNVYKSILRQEIGWFDTKGTGELLNRLVNDTFFVGNSLSQHLSDGLRSSVTIVVGTSMMIYTAPKLAMISCVVVPLVAGVATVYGRYMRTITRELLDKFAQISKEVEERFGNIKTVKIFTKEEQEVKRYDAQLAEAIKIGYREVRARSMFFGMTGLSGNIITVMVLYYGGSLVVFDELSVGALTSFILYAAYSGIAINGLSHFYTELNKGVGASQRLWEIMDRRYLIPMNQGLSPAMKPLGQLEFKDVYFRFPGRADSAVIENLNLILQPGQTTAVVGRSGAGKSTIAMLALRLYDPDQGAVLLDGQDLRQLSPKWFRKHVGAVSQESVLFSGTIRENILYGLDADEQVSEAYFQEITEKAHVTEFTRKLPQGLDTLVGQRGIMLSGGQKQRVAIARALIKNPVILVLDEATSALDSLSEELVQQALEDLGKGRTVLTIAHRLSTIRNADKIAVVDAHAIVESGRYEELIGKENGIFKELVRKQAFLMNS